MPPTAILTLGLPFAFFMAGVAASDILRLHAIERRHLYVMGVLTGLFAVGFMTSSARYAVADAVAHTVIRGYGFLEDGPSYMMFIGTMAFMGLSAPTLFHELTRRFRSLPPSDAPPVSPQI